MKKITIFILSLALLLSASACSSTQKSDDTANENANTAASVSGSDSEADVQDAENVPVAEPIRLVNKMTEKERSRADKHALTILDEKTEPRVSIEFKEITADDALEMLDYFEQSRDSFSEVEYEFYTEFYSKQLEFLKRERKYFVSHKHTDRRYIISGYNSS